MSKVGLTKEQVKDASNCCNLKTIHDCVSCKMYDTNDCVSDLAETALELMEKVEQLEKESKEWKDKYIDLNRYVERKYKDY